MNKNPFISVCIPSYNRPGELERLLGSIDLASKKDVEIVVCEDKSPKRSEIKKIVEQYKKKSDYKVNYRENKNNLGYDKNLRELVSAARGEWLVFMGDDDVFCPGALDRLADFLRLHSELGYVLRSYNIIHYDGGVEKFRYFDGDKFFVPGFDSYVSLFRKSVFISGFSIKREFASDFLTDKFDGTLLFQLYLASEVVLKYPSAYFDEPLTLEYEKELRPEFGSSESEKHLYTPGTVTVENSVNFMKGFLKISGYLDNKYRFNSQEAIKKDISKYSYPVLSIQRDKGIVNFWRYVKKLNQLGFGITIYYYIYVVALIIFGKRICDKIIYILKNFFGKTPQL